MKRLLGAHMSIAGGYYKAAEAGAALGMTTLQIFTKNNAQWKAKPISDEEAARFVAAIEAAKMQSPCSHASYLINLASANPELHEKSIGALGVELERAERLGLVGVVVHPGTATACDEAAGLANIVRSLDRVLADTVTRTVEIWLESTAGQGASLGHRFEHLAQLLEQTGDASRLGICLDTCHLFAAGYSLASPDEYANTMREFDEIIGLPRLRAFHLNDSKKPFASRVDRHEHIGEGHLGLEPFRHIMNDARFEGLPMYLETPKGMRDGESLDALNLATLQGLLTTPKPKNRRGRHKR